MPGGRGRLAFSFEKICQDIAGLAIVVFIPAWVLLWKKLSLGPAVGIPAFCISEFLLGLAVFQLTYRGLWKAVSSEFKARIRYRASDQPRQNSSIKSYSELISWWRNQRAR